MWRKEITVTLRVCCLKGGTGEDRYERQIRKGILDRSNIGTTKRNDKTKTEGKVVSNGMCLDVG